LSEFICVSCGTQYPPNTEPPTDCIICNDPRQYVGFDGQQWTTLDQLRGSHGNEAVALESGLTAIFTQPAFAIGQRALLVESPGGNILWDCIALIDDATIELIESRGGVSVIAISHPHYYTTMAAWSRAFGNIPVYLHSADREWVVTPDPCLRFWDGDRLNLHDGIALIRAGGHFAGGTMLHWPAGADGRGALLSGDIIQVVMDRRWVSFMYSYPNLIPLDETAVHRIVAAVGPFEFERIYGAFHPRQVSSDGKNAVHRSAARYLRAIGTQTG
jgi:hypothetical protein